MSEKKCFVEACTDDPSVVCNCEANPILLCTNHSYDHSQLARAHNFINISSDINSEIRLSIIQLFSKIKSNIKAYKSRIINEELSLIQQLHKTTEKALDNLKICEQKLAEIILEISTLREIDNSKPLTFIETLLSNNSSIADKIKPPKLEIKCIDSNTIANLFNFEPIEESFDYHKSHHASRQAIKFVCNGRVNKYAIFDIESLDVNKFNFKWNRELSCEGIGCSLPYENMFYTWNDSWIIIDSIGNARKIPSYIANYSAGAIYVGGNIYIFGGSENCAVRFNIYQNRWFLLSKYPNPSDYQIVCTLFKNKILIASLSESPVYYDTLTDSYSEILPIKLLRNTAKLFFVKNDRVFLFEFSKFIYESVDNLMTWNNIGECSIISEFSTVVGYPVYYQEAIYILVKNYVYSFNLKEKKVIQVKTFKHSLMNRYWDCYYNG